MIIVDSTNESTKTNNKRKFIERIRKILRENIDRNILDFDSDGKEYIVKVPDKDLDELVLQYDYSTGDYRYVFTDNPGFSEGDRIRKNKDGSKGTGSKASKEGSDGYISVVLSPDEFESLIFDGLELPDLEDRQFRKIVQEEKGKRSFTRFGSPSSMSFIRTFKRSIGRRIALKRPTDEEIEELEKRISEETDEKEKKKLLEELEYKLFLKRIVPFIDDIDAVYRKIRIEEKEIGSAVLFFIMDISGSMNKEKRKLAKKFFLLVRTFLKKVYGERVEIVFICHHSSAKVVGEKEFFESSETGGTIVSSALEIVKKYINEKYNPEDYNIYILQATDGENYLGDNQRCRELINSFISDVNLYICLFLPDTGLFSVETPYIQIFKNVPKSIVHKVADMTDVNMAFIKTFSKRKGEKR